MEYIKVESKITKAKAVDVIRNTLNRFENLFVYYNENKNSLAHLTVLAEIAKKLEEKKFSKSLDRFIYDDKINSLSANTCRSFLLKLKPLADKFMLNVTIPDDVTVYDMSEEELKNKYTKTVNEYCWKIYLNKNGTIKNIKYGTDKTKAQIIYYNGNISDEILMTGEKYDDYGFAGKLLVAANIEVTKETDYNIQNTMLDNGLFYINKEEGWIEKQKYFERMTPKDFLTIQDYKDVTVKAVYKDNGSTGTLTFTYTVGGETKNLFVINASNNQKAREYPTASGNNVFPSDYKDEKKKKEIEMKTTPNDGTTPVDYIPNKFPKGNWNIISFEKLNEKDDKGKIINTEYGPYKIRTDAWREVEVWEESFDDLDKKIWKKKLDENGEVIKTKDAGLLIHGGGYSKTKVDNLKGTNKYTDNTLGCIRISNLDVLLIVEILQTYLNTKKTISLEVK